MSLLVCYCCCSLLLLLPQVANASEEDPDLEVYTQPKGGDFLQMPEFLRVDQVQNILEGSSILLVCRVINLSMHHTVSWLRLSDTQVLTVGGFVFSSDPRVQVFVQTGSWHTSGTWSLRISPVIMQDAGNYQCQVNTEPASVLDITVHVYKVENSDVSPTGGEGADDKPGNGDGAKHPHEKEEEGVHQGEDVGDVAIPAGHDQPAVEEEEEETTGAGVDAGTPVSPPGTGGDGSAAAAGDVIGDGGGQDEDREAAAAVAEGKLVEEEAGRRSSAPVGSAINEDGRGESSSLLIPTVSLFAVICVIFTLGMIRTFYFKPKPEEETGRIRSRTGTLESRKSTRSVESRRSYESRKSVRSVESRRSHRSGDGRSRRRGRQDGEDSETEFRQIRKSSLMPPLIEVVEATPPISSRLYIVQDPCGQPYGLTGFRPPAPTRRDDLRRTPTTSTKMSETSYESEYSDLSDGSSVRTETSDPERQFASVQRARQKRYATRTSLEAQRSAGLVRVAAPVPQVRRTPALASTETLYGGTDHHHSPPPPPTRSTETLYGFLPPPVASANGAGEAQQFAGGHFVPARPLSSGSLVPLASFAPPRNTLERRRIHFNPFEEYSD